MRTLFLRIWCHVIVVITTTCYNFIQLSLNSGSVQVHTLLAACRRFAMVGSLTMVPAGNKAKRLSSVNHPTKTIQLSSSIHSPIRATHHIYTWRYDNLIFLRDFNTGLEDKSIKSFCGCWNLTNLISLYATKIETKQPAFTWF